jgi:hypothetical protein
MTVKNRRYITRSLKKENIATNQHRSSRIFTSNKHNLQERRESENETNYIPTIIDGVTNKALTSQSNPESNVSTCNLPNELRETINVYSRDVCSLSKHKVVFNW